MVLNKRKKYFMTAINMVRLSMVVEIVTLKEKNYPILKNKNAPQIMSVSIGLKNNQRPIFNNMC